MRCHPPACRDPQEAKCAPPILGGGGRQGTLQWKNLKRKLCIFSLKEPMIVLLFGVAPEMQNNAHTWATIFVDAVDRCAPSGSNHRCSAEHPYICTGFHPVPHAREALSEAGPALRGVPQRGGGAASATAAASGTTHPRPAHPPPAEPALATVGGAEAGASRPTGSGAGAGAAGEGRRWGPATGRRTLLHMRADGRCKALLRLLPFQVHGVRAHFWPVVADSRGTPAESEFGGGVRLFGLHCRRLRGVTRRCAPCGQWVEFRTWPIPPPVA